MSYDFDGKRVLVTGGSAGIGRATALAFAEAGADVMIADVDDDRGERVATELRDRGVDGEYVHTDVSSPESVDSLFETIDDQWGELDCAFNNAGIEGEQAPTGDCSLENWHQTLEINLNGVFYCLRRELQRMVDQGDGTIVNMSSVAGQRGFEQLPAYVASK
ncbi:MAG: SDR family NAD(P)-dependent oxidoreductase, partial [Bradymonadaceae bacterium]